MAEIIHESEIQWVSGGSGQARGTSAQQRWFFQGEEGTPDNYEFFRVRQTNDTQFSPRHRHNFDQFRYAIKGPANHSPGQDVPEGQLGYFPEGAYYGPQKLENGTEMVVIQLGGGTGYGFMSYADHRRAFQELSKLGKFEKGVYTRIDENGQRHNKDGHQALWEHIYGQPITFPKPRCNYPIIVDPAAYAWVPDADQPGVSSKHLGTFNERGTRADVVRVARGSALRLETEPRTRLIYMLGGNGAIDGAPVRADHAIRVEKNGPVSVLRADDDMEFLLFGLPRFS